jgi:hypothetical protein
MEVKCFLIAVRVPKNTVLIFYTRSAIGFELVLKVIECVRIRERFI